MPPVPPGAGWVTYVRCHDDIGWAITEEDAAAVGEDGYLHRRFLADFYAGDFPGSFARGARFQADARHGRGAHERHGGVAGRARGGALSAATRWRSSSRSAACCCCTRSSFAHGGVPLIYMGDELGLLNDRAWQTTRPPRRQPLDAPPADGLGGGRAPPRPGLGRGPSVAGLRRLVDARRATRAVHAQGTSRPIRTGNDHVFGLLREHAGDRLLLLANFTPSPSGCRWPRPRARARARLVTWPGRPAAHRDGDALVLEPYQYAWLVSAPDSPR